MSKVADYFFVAGLKKDQLDKRPLTVNPIKLPIQDIAIINRTKGEKIPAGFECYEYTPSNFIANLNHGSLVAPEIFLCFKRGHQKPPITDIGIYENNKKFKVKSNCEVIRLTPEGHAANINNTNDHYYLTICRAPHKVDWDSLAVTDICAILPKKGEMVPHCFHKIDKCLNKGVIGSEMYLCYCKSYIKSKCLTYQPDILLKYPLMDDPNLPDASQLSQFCLPQGARIERWGDTPRQPLPSFTTFVLTNGLNVKKYGVSLSFYIDLPNHCLTDEQKDYFDDDDDDGSRGSNRISGGAGNSSAGDGSTKSNNTEGGNNNGDNGNRGSTGSGGGSRGSNGEGANSNDGGGCEVDDEDVQNIGLNSGGKVFDSSATSANINSNNNRSSGTSKNSITSSNDGDIDEGENTNGGNKAGSKDNGEKTEVKKKDKKYTFKQNQAICILSSEASMEPLKQFLHLIFRLSVSGAQAIPIEKYIYFFLHETHLPSLNKTYLSIHLATEEIVVMKSEETPLPKSGASFSRFLLNFGVDNCVRLLLCVLLEHKIVVHSVLPELLTSIVETISALMFPFSWQCPYIPMCPQPEIIHSPTPFIIGLDSSYLDTTSDSLPTDVTYVHLDAPLIATWDTRVEEASYTLPKKPLKSLKSSLSKLYDELLEDNNDMAMDDLITTGSFNLIDALRQHDQRKIDNKIQEAFLRFMCDVMQGYQHYLLPLKQHKQQGSKEEHHWNGANKFFNPIGFIKNKDRSYHKLLNCITKTQYFCRFIEERSLGSNGNSKLWFFDDCLLKISTNNNEPLLPNHEPVTKETERISLQDSLTEVPGVTYEYGSFEDLKIDRFESTLHNIKKEKKDDEDDDDDEAQRKINKENTVAYKSRKKRKELARSTIDDTNTYTSMKTAKDTENDTEAKAVIVSRTKREKEKSQKLINKMIKDDEENAECILWSCYSLWFCLLPSFLRSTRAKSLVMRLAFKTLLRCLNCKGSDEMPYKVFFQLCCLYREPNLASEAFKYLKEHSFPVSADTYGFYNSTLYQMEEGIKEVNEGMKRWRKTIIIITAVHHLKSLCEERSRRMTSSSSSLSGSTNNQSKSSTSSWSSKRLNRLLETFKSFKDRPSSGRSERFKSDRFAGSVMSVIEKGTGLKINFKISNSENDVNIVSDEKGTLTNNKNNEHYNNSEEENKNKYSDILRKDASYNIDQKNSDNDDDDDDNDENTFNESNEDDVTPNVSLNCNNQRFCPTTSPLALLPIIIDPPTEYVIHPSSKPPLNPSTLPSNDESLDRSIPPSAHTPSHLSTNSTTFAGTNTNMIPTNNNTTNAVKNSNINTAFSTTSIYSIKMDTSNKCPNCASLLLDEHIMAGWLTKEKEEEEEDDDDSLSCLTTCCSILFRSQLHVTIEKTSTTLHFPFINPLNLRHRLECYVTNLNFIGHEDNLLKKDPVLFWNLLWFFKRLKLPTHLTKLLTPFRQETHKQHIKLFWDQPLQVFSTPMYQSFKERKETIFSITSLEAIISGFNVGNFPIQMLLSDRSKFSNSRTSFTYHRGLYHDVLFLIISVYGADSVNLDDFDTKFNDSIGNLDPLTSRKLMTMDFVPSERSRCIRRKFPLLSLP